MLAFTWTKENGNAEALRTQSGTAKAFSALSAPLRFNLVPRFIFLTEELREQSDESTRLDQLIWANLEDIGYGG